MEAADQHAYRTGFEEIDRKEIVDGVREAAQPGEGGIVAAAPAASRIKVRASGSPAARMGESKAPRSGPRGPPRGNNAACGVFCQPVSVFGRAQGRTAELIRARAFRPPENPGNSQRHPGQTRCDRAIALHHARQRSRYSVASGTHDLQAGNAGRASPARRQSTKCAAQQAAQLALPLSVVRPRTNHSVT
jgi:hypothetical protein